MTADGGPSDPEPQEPPGVQAGQIVSLEEIRRTESVISALAARKGVPRGARDDPAVMLLAALSRDVDTADGGVTPPSRAADVSATTITGQAAAGAMAPADRAATGRPLAAVATGWGHDGPAEDVLRPSPLRSGEERYRPELAVPFRPRPDRYAGHPGPSRSAGRRTVRTAVAGLVAAAAVVAMAVVAGPAWRGGSGGALTPLAGSLRSAGQSVPEPPATGRGRQVPAGPQGQERPGASGAGREVPVSPARARAARAPGPGAADGAISVQHRATGSPAAAAGAATTSGGAGARTGPPGGAGTGGARAGSAGAPGAGSRGISTGANRQSPAGSTAGPAGARVRPTRVTAPKAGTQRKGRRHHGPRRQVGAQPWKFWLASPRG